MVALLALVLSADLVVPASATHTLGASKPAVVRHGVWFLRQTQTTGIGEIAFSYGDPGDVPLMGDWDGNGTKTPRVVRSNVWHLRNSNTGGIGEISFVYGDPGDDPLVGDWDGDGDDTLGVHRGDRWHLRNSNTTGIGEVSFQYGDPGDVPFAGDWDGDDVTTVAVGRNEPSIEGCPSHYRNSNTTGVGEIYLDPPSGGFCPHGMIIGDWDRDGYESPGFFNRNDVGWYLANDFGPGGSSTSFHYGNPGDVPLVWQ
jgi:hypothetical protein